MCEKKLVRLILTPLLLFRITAKLAFLPPEPTYALEEDTSAETSNPQSSEQGK